MAQTIADLKDVEFVLYEQFEAEKTLEYDRYKDMGFNRKMFDLIIKEARNFSLKEILPTVPEGDKNGARFEDGKVFAPECYRRPYELFREGEWSSLNEDPEYGGQGLPQLVTIAATEYLLGTNFAFSGYCQLGHGTGKMIEIFGTDKQKELYLKKLYTSEWGGTMLLTEPGAGSDVGNLETTAKKNDDGTWSISGNKIFITSGDHDLTDNIIHPVLARIEGAPAGTAGISLFIVPKVWVNDDGSLGDSNDVVCTGIEEKMGLHGSSTCSLMLGGSGKCRGYLLGEENKGMKVMFHMMNEARLGVGVQGLAQGSAAYLYALDYARQRHQGRALEKILEKDAPQVPIIEHPDVRRMLIQMKAQVEGMRSFVYFIGKSLEIAEFGETPEEREYHKGLADLLTPVLKTYNATRGFNVCVTAMQVFGGYGYTSEYPVEQLARDCKIASIYEGTDGIQAMDLLGRKLGMNNGAIFMNFLGEIGKAVAMAKEAGDLDDLADEVADLVDQFGKTALHMGQKAMSLEFKTAFAHSVPFLEVMGDVVMAWMLLWRAAVASKKISNGAKKKEASFLEGQVQTARYFIFNELEITRGRIQSILKFGSAAVEISDASFGG